MEALTTPLNPLARAIVAMINSAAFPNVAFNKPPTPSPILPANDSVERPIQPASGMMAIAEQIKSAVGLCAPGKNRKTIATGTKMRSQFADGFNFTTFATIYDSGRQVKHCG
jgi:hypothetical protein